VSAMPSGAVSADDRPSTEDPLFERILLASEGRAFSAAAIAKTVELARPGNATVHVFSIARVHGVTFGLQTPGLMPTKAEWKEQYALVEKAIRALKKKGVSAEGHVLGTRKSTKKILGEAAKENCDAIVMGADPDRFRLISDMMWEQEPQRVRRRAKLPVYLVTGE
jgi:nucleotide-binding universal stress UspA family protein